MNEPDCLVGAMCFSVYVFSALLESRKQFGAFQRYRPLPWQRARCRRTEDYQASHSTLPNVLVVVMHY